MRVVCVPFEKIDVCDICDVFFFLRLCEELFSSLMSFVSGRRFQSLSKSEGESKKKNNSARKRESKKSKEQRQDKKQSKTEQKFSFCRQREIVVVSRPPLYCRLLIINYGKPRSTHKSCLSFYTKNGQNTFIWRARRERSNARLARSSVGVAVVVAARRRLL